MPVSGNEQPGITARHPSISSAGLVPIKKRKYPSWNTSLPPQEQKGSVENRQASPSQDSSLLNSSVVATSLGKSDGSENHFVNVKKENLPNSNSSTFSTVQESISLPKTKLQEPYINFGLGAVENPGSREMVMIAFKPAQEVIPSHAEVHLAHKEASSLHVRKVLPVEKNVGASIKLEASAISKDSGLCLASKEPLVPSLSDLRTEGTRKLSDHDAASLPVLLSKEICDTPCESGSDVGLQNADSLERSNRCNWDLNTTMDEWEDPASTPTIPETVVFDGLTGKTVTHEIEPSRDLLGIGDGKGKQILDATCHISDVPVPSSTARRHKTEDSLRLSLGSSLSQLSCRGKNSGLPTLITLPGIPSNVKSLRLSIPTGNAKAVVHPVVKSEPCDESAKTDQAVVEGRSMGLLDPGTGKTELAARHNARDAMVSHMNPQKVTVTTPVKSEPLIDGKREIHVPISQKTVGEIVQQDNLLAIKTIASQTKNLYPSVGLVTHSELLSGSGDILQSESPSAIRKEAQTDMPSTCKVVDRFALESSTLHGEIKERNAYAGTSNTCMPEITKSDGIKRGKLKIIDQDPHCEGSGSEDEKINISNDMLDEGSYGSDYESDGNQVPVVPSLPEQKKVGKYGAEFEDGEVQNSLVRAVPEGSKGDGKDTQNVTLSEFNSNCSNSLGCPGDSNITSAHAVEKDFKIEDCVEMNDIRFKECVSLKPYRSEESTSMQESLTSNLAAAASDEERPTKADVPIDQYERNDAKHDSDQELSSCGALTGGEGGEKIVAQSADGNTIENDISGKKDSPLPTGEPFTCKDAAKDSCSGGNRSRIIHLPRGSTNISSPCKTRPFSERSRYTDSDGEKFHPQRNREEFYRDGPRKFLRDRIHGQPFRNLRQNYGRGRGRGYGRSNSSTDWNSDCTFASGNYKGPTDFRFSRHKRTPVVADEELECNSYLRELDEDDFVGCSGKGGRRPETDDFPSFRRPSSRRLSPGVRNGPATRGVPVLRRVPRNISPDRCADEDGSGLVDLRPNENFLRGMPDAMTEPVYACPQPSYEGLDSQFVRGDRSFYSGQRRPFPPRIRSKSPDRSRTRSPRRSADGFDGLSEFTNRGSPVLFRMGRIRSPQRPCFPDDIVHRGRGSPPFITRPDEMRETNVGRAHGHRVLPKHTRRFDGLEGRERMENDNYVGGGPLRPGRFPDVGGDDARRSFGERRRGGGAAAIVRPFRPNDDADCSDGETFRSPVETEPTRPFRLCPELEPELIERNNRRDMEFERRFKNRPVIAPRRLLGTVDDPDGGGAYRQGGWNGGGFDAGTHVKRRRF